MSEHYEHEHQHQEHQHHTRRCLRIRLLPRTFRGKIALAIALLVAVFLAIALALQAMFFSRIYDRSSYRLYQVAQGSTLPAPENGELYVSTTGCYYTNYAVGCGPLTPGSIMEISDADMRKPLMQSAMWFSLALFAAFAVLAMIMAWLISRRLAGRISSLGAQMQQLDPAEPGGRVTLAGSDEVTDLARDVNDMLERIERAATTQRQFIANASHELRTPIAVIETSLDAPLSQGRFPVDVAPAVQRALAADRNAADLVEGLLALSRVQNMALHHGDAQPSETSLVNVVEQVLDNSWDAIEARGLDVHTDINQCARVHADTTMLTLMVGNLIRNAIVHNVECGDIEVTVLIANECTELRVENSTESDAESKIDGDAYGSMDSDAYSNMDSSASDISIHTTQQNVSNQSSDRSEDPINGSVTQSGNPATKVSEPISQTSEPTNYVAHDTVIRDNAASDSAHNTVSDSTSDITANKADVTASLDDLLIPFHRGTNSRLENRPGNGLGLSIVKEIADLYHAELRLARPQANRFAVSVRFCDNYVHNEA